MDKSLQTLTEKIKHKFQKELFKTKDMHKITLKNIDREFTVDLNELSISELDFEMAKRASSIKEMLDPGKYVNGKPGRNRILKIMLLFPFLFRLVFKGTPRIIKDFMSYNNILAIRIRKTDERITELEENISSIKDLSVTESLNRFI